MQIIIEYNFIFYKINTCVTTIQINVDYDSEPLICLPPTHCPPFPCQSKHYPNF